MEDYTHTYIHTDTRTIFFFLPLGAPQSESESLVVSESLSDAILGRAGGGGDFCFCFGDEPPDDDSLADRFFFFFLASASNS